MWKRHLYYMYKFMSYVYQEVQYISKICRDLCKSWCLSSSARLNYTCSQIYWRAWAVNPVRELLYHLIKIQYSHARQMDILTYETQVDQGWNSVCSVKLSTKAFHCWQWLFEKSKTPSHTFLSFSVIQCWVCKRHNQQQLIIL